MADRYDVVIPRKYEKGGETKTAWTKVGAAWPTKSGEGFNVKLDFPVGVTEFSLFPPKDRNDTGI